MDRERAETHLRQLAEAELRRATAPGARGAGHVRQAAAGRAGADRGGRGRRGHRRRDPGRTRSCPGRAAVRRGWRGTAAAGEADAGLAPPGRHRGVRRVAAGTWRVVPVGQVIRIRDGDGPRRAWPSRVPADRARRPVHDGRLDARTCAGTGHASRRVLACPSPAASSRPMTRAPAIPSASAPGSPAPRRWRACSTCARTRSTRSAGWTCAPLPASPPRASAWTPQVPAPDITVTNTAASPGELLADVIAARVLALASNLPQETPGQLAAAGQGYCRMSPAGSVTSSPRCRPPARCPRRARPRASSPGCAPAWVSAATASPRHPPPTCRNGG